MRVQLGHTPDRPVQLLHTGAGPVLVLCEGMRVSAEVVRRLDDLLRTYEPHAPHTPRMFRYAAAAEALGVSPQWLKTRIKNNEIPYHRVGTYVRFTAEDIETIRDSMRRGPAAGRTKQGGT